MIKALDGNHHSKTLGKRLISGVEGKKLRKMIKKDDKNNYNNLYHEKAMKKIQRSFRCKTEIAKKKISAEKVIELLNNKDKKTLKNAYTTWLNDCILIVKHIILKS